MDVEAEPLRRARRGSRARVEARRLDLRPALVATAAAAMLGALLMSAGPARSEPAQPAGPRAQAASNEDIVVTARRQVGPSLKEVQDYNAAELARLRPLYEPPPPHTRPYEADMVAYHTPLGQKMEGMFEGSPRLRDTLQTIDENR